MQCLDIEMSGNRDAACEEIQELNPQITVVFATAFSQYAVEAFELNVFDYVMKPVSKERLRKTLTALSIADNSSAGFKAGNDLLFPRFECKIDGEVIPLNHFMKAKELLAFW